MLSSNIFIGFRLSSSIFVKFKISPKLHQLFSRSSSISGVSVFRVQVRVRHKRPSSASPNSQHLEIQIAVQIVENPVVKRKEVSVL